MQRRGLLLAVSSLPGKYGIGDFSSSAYKFIDLLKKHGFKIWQILPLNPVGYGHSPYQPFSSYAFDEIYISIDDLKKRFNIDNIEHVKSTFHSDYETARLIKEKSIKLAYDVFTKDLNSVKMLEKYLEENKTVREHCEFITLKEANDNKCWNEWTIKDKKSLKGFKDKYLLHGFAQMILAEEWHSIRTYANNNGIEIMGDLPFYVGYDSSDLLYNKDSFLLEGDLPLAIAGVPPDYFSPDGQRWGNPIYDWEYLNSHDFQYMIDRISHSSSLYDIVRIDHFRAFDSYWAINPECKTAVDGEWRYPDGYKFFDTLYSKYPNINIVVEDLGDLRPQVLKLRDDYELPGMREFQFTIMDDEFYNKRIEKENQLYYSSTHDNETMREWVCNLPLNIRKNLLNKFTSLGIKGDDLVDKILGYCLSRKENMIILNVTDVLKLTKKYRMNKPGIIDDVNWTFKLKSFIGLDRKLKKLIEG